MTGLTRMLLATLLAGWLADRLASPDRDVEAGIEAYEAGDLDEALARFEAAISRHGDQPELSYDRGLVRLAQGEPEEARRAFERGSETEDLEVRASAFYERGNVAFDAQRWDQAIEAYIECLEARPDHANAKWNLELALQRKQEDPEDEEEEEEDDESTGGDDSGGSDSSGGTGGTGEAGSSGDTGTTGESGDGDSGTGDSGTGGDTGGTAGGSGESGGESGGEEGDSGGETGEDRPPSDTDSPPDDGGTGGAQPPPPQPLDEMDIQRALDELDQQDQFPLDRPLQGVRPPTEDW